MFNCKICASSFSRPDSLHRHLKKYHSSQQLCEVCGVVLEGGVALHKHRCSDDEPPSKKFKGYLSQTQATTSKHIRCNVCDEDFTTTPSYVGHLRTQRHLQNMGEPLENGVVKIKSAFKTRIASYRIPSPQDQTDIPSFLESCEEKFIWLVDESRRSRQSVKINIEMFGLYVKPGDDVQPELKSFNTRFQIGTPTTDLSELYQRLCSTVKTKSEEFQVSTSIFMYFGKLKKKITKCDI